jgi:hypothetical protein
MHRERRYDMSEEKYVETGESGRIGMQAKSSAHQIVEELAAEIARLGEQQRVAQAEVERAAERLEGLNARRAALSPSDASGENGAAKELGALIEALDEELATVSRTKTIAEDAARELDRLVLQAKVRHREAEKRLARERYEALCEERYSLDGEAEQAMSSLLEVLDRLEGLYADQLQAADAAEHSYPAQQDPRGTVEHWLTRRLRRWLPNGSFEKYDAPLYELDPLARKPAEEGGGSA